MPEPSHSPVGKYPALLSEAERTAAAAFRVPGKRRRYVLGRVLLRSVLAEVLQAEPANIPLVLGRNNRPRLADPRLADANSGPGVSLDFNLSSTPGRIACGLVLGGRVGVDVEAARPLDDLPDLARTVLAPEERAWMRAQPDSLASFYRLWTLKEAVAKAHGEGLGLPFDRLRMQPGEGKTLHADFGVIESTTDAWSVLGLEASGAAALAVHWDRGRSGPIDLSPPLPAGCALEPLAVDVTARL